MRLYDHYKHPEPWDKNLAADLIPPIRHLRKTFDDHHWSYGRVTEKFCYNQLHPDEADEDIKEYLRPLQQLKGIVGVAATERFVELFKMGTAPAVFKAFFDLYLDGMTASALARFFQLVAVGKANEHRLDVPHLEWAEGQTKNMIRSKMHVIEIWVRNVCDKQPYDPTEDIEEQIFWRKWQAPRLLVMKPSRYMPYEPARTWEKFEPEESRGLLEAHAEDYVLHIESRLEKIAGQAAVELAMQPKPVSTPAQEVPTPPEPSPKVDAQPHRLGTTRREEQRKDTQAKYKGWQKEYRSLKKTYPDRSDVWYSLKISRMDIGKGRSSETIRKHMKGK